MSQGSPPCSSLSHSAQKEPENEGLDKTSTKSVVNEKLISYPKQTLIRVCTGDKENTQLTAAYCVTFSRDHTEMSACNMRGNFRVLIFLPSGSGQGLFFL